jgi:hypothetical protein
MADGRPGASRHSGARDGGPSGFRVTTVTTRRDFRATDCGIPRCFGPFDRRVVSHLQRTPASGPPGRGNVCRKRSRNCPVRTDFITVYGSTRLSHQQRQSTSKVLLSLVHIVQAASELDVLDHGRATDGVRLHVVKLEETALDATAVCADERALATISFPHFSLPSRRDVTRIGCNSASRARTRRRGKLGSLQVRDEQRQCPIEDRG